MNTCVLHLLPVCLVSPQLQLQTRRKLLNLPSVWEKPIFRSLQIVPSASSSSSTSFSSAEYPGIVVATEVFSITVKFQATSQNFSCHLTGVYAPNTTTERKELWWELAAVRGLCELPWVLHLPFLSFHTDHHMQAGIILHHFLAFTPPLRSAELNSRHDLIGTPLGVLAILVMYNFSPKSMFFFHISPQPFHQEALIMDSKIPNSKTTESLGSCISD
ncbi:hypothetical protein H5410_016214 [Solanum commersonii]|uniref:Uncharacterized protein n=1 Tax=Solanum commersonii TaxID=4109 RepID=A0A9J5ZVT1_SOLCO|nr:hypothetical protein H5410_016214 [Solanum commersonii]